MEEESLTPTQETQWTVQRDREQGDISLRIACIFTYVCKMSWCA